MRSPYHWEQRFASRFKKGMLVYQGLHEPHPTRGWALKPHLAVERTSPKGGLVTYTTNRTGRSSNSRPGSNFSRRAQAGRTVLGVLSTSVRKQRLKVRAPSALRPGMGDMDPPAAEPRGKRAFWSATAWQARNEAAGVSETWRPARLQALMQSTVRWPTHIAWSTANGRTLVLALMPQTSGLAPVLATLIGCAPFLDARADALL